MRGMQNLTRMDSWNCVNIILFSLAMKNQPQDYPLIEYSMMKNGQKIDALLVSIGQHNIQNY
jgi:hypothetical protein